MKQAHIYIYGVIASEGSSLDSGVNIVNLKSVINQLNPQGSFDELVVHIHSEGGEVNEGFAIYDYLTSLGKPITTQIEGNCFSIATVIALAGDKRTMTENAKILIHNPLGMVSGEKEDFVKYASQLQGIEVQLSELYASKTELTTDSALKYMKEETSFNFNEALKIGFITEAGKKLKAVALYRPKIKKKNNKNKTNMSKEILTKKEADKKFNSLGETLNNILNIITGKSKVVNLIVQDANGVEIDFTELEADATPVVGNKATVDGETANGEYVMPSGETYIFENGTLTEIKEEEEESQDIEALKQEVEGLKQENEQLKVHNKKTEEDLGKASIQMQNFVSEFKELKKNVSSSFNYDPKIDGKTEGKTETKSRRLFKKN